MILAPLPCPAIDLPAGYLYPDGLADIVADCNGASGVPVFHVASRAEVFRVDLGPGWWPRRVLADRLRDDEDAARAWLIEYADRADLATQEAASPDRLPPGPPILVSWMGAAWSYCHGRFSPLNDAARQRDDE